jgi:hypothetical protein
VLVQQQYLKQVVRVVGQIVCLAETHCLLRDAVSNPCNPPAMCGVISGQMRL